jgi:hypothetical protein
MRNLVCSAELGVQCGSWCAMRNLVCNAELGVQFAAGDAVLVTGQQEFPQVMHDGPRGTASFAKPRGLCVERTTGHIIVVDGPSPWDPMHPSHSAVLRTVTVSGSTYDASGVWGP